MQTPQTCRDEDLVLMLPQAFFRGGHLRSRGPATMAPQYFHDKRAGDEASKESVRQQETTSEVTVKDEGAEVWPERVRETDGCGRPLSDRTMRLGRQRPRLFPPVLTSDPTLVALLLLLAAHPPLWRYQPPHSLHRLSIMKSLAAVRNNNSNKNKCIYSSTTSLPRTMPILLSYPAYP